MRNIILFLLLFVISFSSAAQKDSVRMLNVPITITPALLNKPKLNGYVDMHTHPVAQFGFGEQLFYGHNDGEPSKALGSCNCIHNFVVWPFDGNCGEQNMFRNQLVDKTDQGNHAPVHQKVAGFPSFAEWPKHNSILHQQMWVDWIRRAKEGGLRVMVALAVSNHCMADAAETGGPNDDMRAMDRQIREIKSLAGRHNDFMEVAYNSDDLRRIVTQNKLAIVVGIEMDNIGNFYNPADGKGGTYNPNPKQQDVKAEIDRLYASGVRYIFPVHVTDNVFSGAAVYVPDFNVANKYNTGKPFQVEVVDSAKTGIFFKMHHPFMEIRQSITDPTITFVSQMGIPPPPGFEVIGGPFLPMMQALFYKVAQILPGHIMPDVRANYPEYPDPGKGKGHRNIKGLTPMGMYAVNYMMSKGMIIDIDHMSEKAADQALAIATIHSYPLNSGHNGFRGLKAGTENSRTDSQVVKITRQGGMLGLGHGENALNFLRNYRYGLKLTGNKPIAIGTDANGLYPLPGPPSGNARLPEGNVFRTMFMGNKTWDYNRDGVAHYGLLPAYIESMSVIPKQGMTAQEKEIFFSSAEYFAQMWEKCTDAAARINKVSTETVKTFNIPAEGMLCPLLSKGDREFGGHGPEVNCTVTLRITPDGLGVDAMIEMIAKETSGGDTEAKGFWTRRVYNAPGGTKIAKVNGDSKSTATFVSGGAGSEFGICNEGLVYSSDAGQIRITGSIIKSIVMVGDTGGPDVTANPSDCRCDTKISKITFNPISVTVKPL
jgi:microsomal dipeptidase-like Zn-dependent dipeptidase